MKPKVSQYIIAPAVGMAALETAERSFLGQLHSSLSLKKAFSFAAVGEGGDVSLRVVDSIGENKPKLIECAPEDLARLRASHPSVRVLPVVYFRRAVVRHQVQTKAAGAAAKAAVKAIKIRVTVVSSSDNKPVPGVLVVAFTDFAAKEGAQGTTNGQGTVALSLGATGRKIERLYLYPKDSAWPGLSQGILLKSGAIFKLDPIDLAYNDCVRYFYSGASLNDGEGIKAGVIDSGVATNHPDLVVQGGSNTVPGEKASDFGDNGTEGHGTHVAGIIAGRGTPPRGIRGVAPGVTLRSYRVFSQGGDQASNYAIAKAIDAAVSDGCDLINMSLGGGDPDSLTADALAAAQSAGVVVFAANGNDNRQPVSFPAADSLCQAVAAMGRIGTFPRDTEPSGSVAAPYGTDKKNFVASFSNIGPETDLTGPGVGVISTVPTGYGVMSGTSMATPAATGAAARLLAGHHAIIAMPRSKARAAAMISAIATAARSFGFGAIYEGKGRIQP